MWFGILIVCILLIVAASCKGSKVIDEKPSKIIKITSELGISDVYKKLLKYSQNCAYKVESLDEEKHVIVFGDDATLTSYGFLYPIYLSEENGKTIIEIGIKSKAFQVGPIVTKSHEKFVNNIKIAVMNLE